MSNIQEKLNYMPSIKFKKTNPDAQLPKKNNPTDTGFDLYAVEDKLIPARGSAVVDNGLQVAYISPGYWIRIESRSGMSFKHGLLAHPGIIDQEYRSGLAIKIYNHSDTDYQIKKGDKIAQAVIYYNIDIDLSWGEVQESVRGTNGLGSSGR